MDELDRVLNEIDQDTASGSAELADKLLITLIRLEPQLSTSERKAVSKKIDQLSAKKPFFAVLSHLAETVRKSDADWSILQAYRNRVDQATKKISEKLISLISAPSKRVLLHSHSKTIVSAFEFFAERSIQVKILQTISEPEREGTIQAERLQRLGFNVTLIEDDPEISMVESVDFFITGADLILPSHFINKSGTRKLAEKIKAACKPYFVLADQRKFTSTDVTELPPSFERITRTLVTKVITGE